MGPKKTIKTVTVSVCVGKMHSDVSLSLSLGLLSGACAGGSGRGSVGMCTVKVGVETLEFLCH